MHRRVCHVRRCSTAYVALEYAAARPIPYLVGLGRWARDGGWRDRVVVDAPTTDAQRAGGTAVDGRGSLH